MDTIALIIGGFVIFLVVAITAAVARMNNGVKTINPTQGLPPQSTQGRLARELIEQSTQALSAQPSQPSQPLVLPPDFEQEIQRLLTSGQWMAAIKLCRDVTGGDLKRAKTMVETMSTSRITVPVQQVFNAHENMEIDQQIRAMFNAGQKIDAIKLYREVYKTGLKEAKDAVERMTR